MDAVRRLMCKETALARPKVYPDSMHCKAIIIIACHDGKAPLEAPGAKNGTNKTQKQIALPDEGQETQHEYQELSTRGPSVTTTGRHARTTYLPHTTACMLHHCSKQLAYVRAFHASCSGLFFRKMMIAALSVALLPTVLAGDNTRTASPLAHITVPSSSHTQSQPQLPLKTHVNGVTLAGTPLAMPLLQLLHPRVTVTTTSASGCYCSPGMAEIGSEPRLLRRGLLTLPAPVRCSVRLISRASRLAEAASVTAAAEQSQELLPKPPRCNTYTAAGVIPMLAHKRRVMT
jgi:hypothetical protein